MKTICALVDINIIIDDMAKREPFFEAISETKLHLFFQSFQLVQSRDDPQ
jgi:hypothetical protein